MQEFSSISVSSYEAGSLSERLTEHSRDGWDVVAIVPTGNTVTAYLCREASDAVPAPAADTPAAASIADVPSSPEPASEPAASEPADEPTLTGIAATDTAATGTAAATDTAATDTAATAGAAPAGWYADPSGRFELRYWDGGQWTEHVSRAGQQYTDPPVA